jgi:hypothetical protein
MVRPRRWLLALLLVIGTADAVEVTATWPDPCVPHAVVPVEIIITDPPAPVTQVTLPQVEGLDLQLGRTGSQTSIINGQRQHKQTIHLSLRARALGSYAVPSVVLHLQGGDTLTTTPTTLHVTPGDARLTGDLVGEVAFAPSTIVPGEATVMTYRLWVRTGEIQTLGIQPPPGAIVLQDRELTKGRAYDAQGRPWMALTATWTLTWAEPGPHTVRGQQEAQVSLGDGFFDQRVARQSTAITPATITVTPLPDLGRPADFTGLIGPVGAAARWERERVAVGEGVQLILTITGRQVDLARRPPLALTGATAYPKEVPAESGQRVFAWDVVPTHAGTVTLDTIGVPYFDPVGKTYRTATASPGPLEVVPGRARDLGAVGAITTTPAATDPPAVVSPTMPPPWRHQAPHDPPRHLAPLMGVGLALLGGLVAWWQGRGPRTPRTGALLRRAAQDPAALAALVERLVPVTPTQQAAHQALGAALAAHRFGGAPLPDLAPWLRDLEDLP